MMKSLRSQKLKFFVKLFFKKVCRCGQSPQKRLYWQTETLRLCLKRYFFFFYMISERIFNRKLRFIKNINLIMKNASFSVKFFVKLFKGKVCRVLDEYPVDIRPAPTGAKRRLYRVHKKNFIDKLKYWERCSQTLTSFLKERSKELCAKLAFRCRVLKWNSFFRWTITEHQWLKLSFFTVCKR